MSASHPQSLQTFWFLSYIPEPLSLTAQTLLARDRANPARAAHWARLLLRCASGCALEPFLLPVQLAQLPLHAGEGRSAPAGVRLTCVCRSALACRACAVCTRGSYPCLLLLPIPARRSGGVLGLLLAGCGRCACPRNQLLIPPLLTCAHRSGGVLGLLLAVAVGAVFTRGSWIFTPDAAVQAAVGQLAPIAMLALGICAGGLGGRVNSFE